MAPNSSKSYFNLIKNVHWYFLRIKNHVVILKDRLSLRWCLRCKDSSVQSRPRVSFIVVEVSKLFNQTAVVNSSVLISIAGYEIMEKLSVLLLQILWELSSAINDSHELFVFKVMSSVRVGCEAIHRNVLEILLQEEFPLVERSKLLMNLNLPFKLLKKLVFIKMGKGVHIHG